MLANFLGVLPILTPPLRALAFIMCSKSNPIVVFALDLMSTYEGEHTIFGLLGQANLTQKHWSLNEAFNSSSHGLSRWVLHPIYPSSTNLLVCFSQENGKGFTFIQYVKAAKLKF
jgi:hypothetical protein